MSSSTCFIPRKGKCRYPCFRSARGRRQRRLNYRLFYTGNSKVLGAQGSLINHSEHRIDRPETIQNLVDNLRKLQMISVVCARSAAEVADIARFKPDYIAIEPPELIGSGKAVSKENPAIVTDSIEAAAKVSQEVKVICGAGITDAADVRSALKLGAKGILVASGVIKANSWVDKISELASGYK